jgi:hypothetical protein
MGSRSCREPASNGNVAADAVIRASPTATRSFSADSLITINPHVHASLPYDPLKDFCRSRVSHRPVLPRGQSGRVKTCRSSLNTPEANPPMPMHWRQRRSISLASKCQPAPASMLPCPIVAARRPARRRSGRDQVVLAGASSAGLLKRASSPCHHRRKRSPLFPTCRRSPILSGYDSPSGSASSRCRRPEPIAQASHRGAEGAAEATSQLNVTGALEPLSFRPPLQCADQARL